MDLTIDYPDLLTIDDLAQDYNSSTDWLHRMIPNSEPPAPDLAGANVLDKGTSALVDQLHAAWRSHAPVSVYAEIRDRLLADHELVELGIATLTDISHIAWPHLNTSPDVVDAGWQSLFSLANAAGESIEARGRNPSVPSKRKRLDREVIRKRNLALVAALWSPEAVLYYGWHTVGQSQMKMIRACAIKFPHFEEDFAPRLNAALLDRHCGAIMTGHGKTINEARLQPSKDLDLSRLMMLPSLEWTLESLWLTDEDGEIPLDDSGTLLKHLRPYHFRQYLLSKDRYGILIARREATSSDAFLNMAAPSSLIAQATLTAGANESQPTCIAPSLLDRQLVEPAARRSSTVISTPEDIDAVCEPIGPESVPSYVTYDPDGDLTQAHSSMSYLLRQSVRDKTMSEGNPFRGLNICEEHAGHEDRQRSTHSQPSLTLGHHSRSTGFRATDGEPRSCVSWLRDINTQPATIWPSSSINFQVKRVPSERDADVLQYTSGDFIEAARRGRKFCRPVIIKEEFADSGMHTIPAFARLVRDAFRSNDLNIKDGMGEALSIEEMQRFVNFTTSGRTIESACAFTLGNVTKAHKPLFTMLGRFRLLESLLERFRCKQNRHGNLMLEDLEGCPGFNTLYSPGGSGGPRLNALSGTWIRNLQGQTCYAFAPEDRAHSRQRKINGATQDWIPDENQRWAVLEQDDVLLLPPGLRVVYVAFSPNGSLVEGGTMWDDNAVIEIFRSIHWSFEHRVQASERTHGHLWSMIQELSDLVHVEPDRFRGDVPVDQFKSDYASAVKALEGLQPSPNDLVGH